MYCSKSQREKLWQVSLAQKGNKCYNNKMGFLCPAHFPPACMILALFWQTIPCKGGCFHEKGHRKKQALAAGLPRGAGGDRGKPGNFQPPLLEDGSVTTRCNGHTIHCLTIIGQIEGHYILPSQNKTTKYEHVIPQIVAVEEDPQIDGLLMLLNTVGGDVEAGLALAELVAGMKKPTVSLVLGGGHSIGVPLAVAAKRSFIAESASMTIHPCG